MDEGEARHILGVGSRASAEEVRAAFRQLVRRTHPDLVPDDARAGRSTASLVEAYAILRSLAIRPDRAGPPPAGPPPSTGRSAGTRPEVIDGGDSLVVAGPSDEVYRRLVEVAHEVGEITYVDPDARLLDTVVTAGGAACSLLASLQGRGAHTEVFFTLEPLGGEAHPPVEPLVRAIAVLLGDRPG